MKRADRTRLVLFDLDGTLADTAPDLAYALNHTLGLHGREQLPYETIRPHVSHGGLALIRLAFNIGPGDPGFETLRQEFLGIYQQNIARLTTLFPGMGELLASLEQDGIAWGIVTNKPSWLTDPLVEQLNLSQRAACVVSGDTTDNRKPHPGPIIHACELAGANPEETLYIGDAERDITAGNRAGTTTLAAEFGYLGAHDRPDEWCADGTVAHPMQVLEWLIPPGNG